jgi:hypothetical protein
MRFLMCPDVSSLPNMGIVGSKVVKTVPFKSQRYRNDRQPPNSTNRAEPWGVPYNVILPSPYSI